MISANAYEEIYEILSLMDKLAVMKIPEETLKIINKKRNKTFKTKIDKNDIFNEQNVSKETIDVLCYFDYYYWIDENKKNEVDKIHKLKLKKAEEEKKLKYNPNNVFKNNNLQTLECKEENNFPTEIKQNNFFYKLIEFLKRILN